MVMGLQHMEGDSLLFCSQLLLGFHRQNPAGVSARSRGELGRWKAQNRDNRLWFGRCGLTGESRPTPCNQGEEPLLPGVCPVPWGPSGRCGNRGQRPRRFLILLSSRERKTWEEPLLLPRPDKPLGEPLQDTLRGWGKQMARHLGIWQEESLGIWQRALI